ncbi:MAG: hypothetical protein IMX00_08600 [Limnochordales bacterium]|nr:hypothetical protein [Limnochordales bacterium]
MFTRRPSGLSQLLITATLLFAALVLARTAVAAAPSPTPKPAPGTIVNLKSPPPLYLAEPFTYTEGGPDLLFSDQPEYVKGEGILSRATFSGPWRLFVYHVNEETTGYKYFPVIIRNLGEREVNVTVTRQGVRGPSQGYLWVGQESLRDFLLPQHPRTITIPAGGWALLDPVGLSRPVAYNQLIEGLYEGDTDGPIEMLVLAANSPSDLDPARFEPIPVPAGEVNRGTFGPADRTVNLENAGEEAVWLLASGNYYDTFLTGRDELDGNTRVNFGNYGVIYHVNLRLRAGTEVAETATGTSSATEAGRGRKVRIYFGSGSGCGFAGAILVTAGPGAGRVIRIPETPRRYFSGYGTEMSYIAEVELRPGEETLFSFDFMPPGASCLPALLYILPVAEGGD